MNSNQIQEALAQVAAMPGVELVDAADIMNNATPAPAVTPPTVVRGARPVHLAVPGSMFTDTAQKTVYEVQQNGELRRITGRKSKARARRDAARARRDARRK